MAKMKMTPSERPKVRAECMRLLARLKLDPARSKLIGAFVESYLQLNAAEMKRYERAIATFTPQERQETMGLVSSWEQKGIEIGKEELVIRLIRRRFGTMSDPIKQQLDQLSADQLDVLGENLLDFTRAEEIEQWLTRQLATTK